jgi:nicotinamidase-related amidase
VLKAKHSGFYDTQLDLLIDYLKVKTLVITGFTTDVCVLFTASDAYMRDLEIIIPVDCVACANNEHHERAIDHMERVLNVKTVLSTELDLSELVDQSTVRAE